MVEQMYFIVFMILVLCNKRAEFLQESISKYRRDVASFLSLVPV